MIRLLGCVVVVAFLAIDCAGPVNEPETPREFPDDTSGHVTRGE